MPGPVQGEMKMLPLTVRRRMLEHSNRTAAGESFLGETVPETYFRRCKMWYRCVREAFWAEE